MDWRDFFSFLHYGLSEKNYREINKLPSYQVTTRREIAKEYITSKWFIIDILSIIPFDIIFGSLGFLNASRILRLSRLPRMFHLIKSVKIKHIKNQNPAFIRFTYIFISAPFLMHFYSCTLFLFQSDTLRNSVNYWQNFHTIFKAMKTGLPFAMSTASGMIFSYLVAFTGFIFLGAFIGNFAGLLIYKDHHNQSLENKLRQYEKLAKKYPAIFDNGLMEKIIEELKEKNCPEFQEKQMIEALSAELEKEIKERIQQTTASKEHPLTMLKKIYMIENSFGLIFINIIDDMSRV